MTRMAGRRMIEQGLPERHGVFITDEVRPSEAEIAMEILEARNAVDPDYKIWVQNMANGIDWDGSGRPRPSQAWHLEERVLPEYEAAVIQRLAALRAQYPNALPIDLLERAL